MSEFVPLGDHITVLKGKAPLETGFAGPGAEPYLNPEYLRGRADADLVKAGPDAVRTADGDTILLWDGSNAGEFFRARPGLLASTMAKISPSKAFLPAYFFHVSKHAESRLKSQASGTGIPHVDRELLEAIRVFCPSSTQQRVIAAILDTLDTAIHETEAIIAKLKAVKQGLLHDLLTRGIDANGELRPLPTEAPHLYKPSPLGLVPKAWEVKTVSEVADIRSGATPSREQANRYFAARGIPWVKTLDLNEDFIIDTHECITTTALRETSCSLLPEGTVLVAMYGGWEQIGRTALLAVPAATNQAISALLFRSSSVVPEFILRALQHGRPRWHRVAASTRKDPNITKADVLAFEIPLPAPDEQAEIVRRLRTCGDRLESEGSMLAKLRHQKAGLMDDLLTGRVRVTPLLQEAQHA